MATKPDAPESISITERESKDRVLTCTQTEANVEGTPPTGLKIEDGGVNLKNITNMGKEESVRSVNSTATSESESFWESPSVADEDTDSQSCKQVLNRIEAPNKEEDVDTKASNFQEELAEASFRREEADTTLLLSLTGNATKKLEPKLDDSDVKDEESFLAGRLEPTLVVNEDSREEDSPPVILDEENTETEREKEGEPVQLVNNRDFPISAAQESQDIKIDEEHSSGLKLGANKLDRACVSELKEEESWKASTVEVTDKLDNKADEDEVLGSEKVEKLNTSKEGSANESEHIEENPEVRKQNQILEGPAKHDSTARGTDEAAQGLEEKLDDSFVEHGRISQDGSWDLTSIKKTVDVEVCKTITEEKILIEAEAIETEKEGKELQCVNTEGVPNLMVTQNPDIQNDEVVASESGVAANKFDGLRTAEAKGDPSSQKPVLEKVDEIREKMDEHDETELVENSNHEIVLEDKIKENTLASSPASESTTEDMNMQKVDTVDTFEEFSANGSDGTVEVRVKEVKPEDEVPERTEVHGAIVSEIGNAARDLVQNKGEEALTGVVEDPESSEAKKLQTKYHKQEHLKQKDVPECSSLEEDEPEVDDRKRSLNVNFQESKVAASGEHPDKLTCVEEEGPIENKSPDGKEKFDVFEEPMKPAEHEIIASQNNESTAGTAKEAFMVKKDENTICTKLSKEGNVQSLHHKVEENCDEKSPIDKEKSEDILLEEHPPENHEQLSDLPPKESETTKLIKDTENVMCLKNEESVQNLEEGSDLTKNHLADENAAEENKIKSSRECETSIAGENSACESNENDECTERILMDAPTKKKVDTDEFQATVDEDKDMKNGLSKVEESEERLQAHEMVRKLESISNKVPHETEAASEKAERINNREEKESLQNPEEALDIAKTFQAQKEETKNFEEIFKESTITEASVKDENGYFIIMNKNSSELDSMEHNKRNQTIKDQEDIEEILRKEVPTERLEHLLNVMPEEAEAADSSERDGESMKAKTETATINIEETTEKETDKEENTEVNTTKENIARDEDVTQDAEVCKTNQTSETLLRGLKEESSVESERELGGKTVHAKTDEEPKQEQEGCDKVETECEYKHSFNTQPEAHDLVTHNTGSDVKIMEENTCFKEGTSLSTVVACQTSSQDDGRSNNTSKEEAVELNGDQGHTIDNMIMSIPNQSIKEEAIAGSSEHTTGMETPGFCEDYKVTEKMLEKELDENPKLDGVSSDYEEDNSTRDCTFTGSQLQTIREGTHQSSQKDHREQHNIKILEEQKPILEVVLEDSSRTNEAIKEVAEAERKAEESKTLAQENIDKEGTPDGNRERESLREVESENSKGQIMLEEGTVADELGMVISKDQIVSKLDENPKLDGISGDYEEDNSTKDCSFTDSQPQTIREGTQQSSQKDDREQHNIKVLEEQKSIQEVVLEDSSRTNAAIKKVINQEVAEPERKAEESKTLAQEYIDKEGTPDENKERESLREVESENSGGQIMLEKGTVADQLSMLISKDQPVNNVNNSNQVPVPIFNATDCNEMAAMEASELAEDQIMVAEALFPIKALEGKESAQEISDKLFNNTIIEDAVSKNTHDQLCSASATKITKKTKLSEEKTLEHAESDEISSQSEEFYDIKLNETTKSVTQLPNIVYAKEDKETVIMGKPEASKPEDSKRDSDAVFESTDQPTGNIDEIEQTKELSKSNKTLSNEKQGELIALPEKSNLIGDLMDSSVNKSIGQAGADDEVSPDENQENVSGLNSVESLLESENITRLSLRLTQTAIEDIIPIEVSKQCKEASDPKSEKITNCSDYVAEHKEALSKLEDISTRSKAEPPQRTQANLRADDNQLDEDNATNEIINRISNEENPEDKELVMPSQPVSFGKDKPEERLQEIKQTAEEYARMETSKMLQNAENRLPTKEVGDVIDRCTREAEGKEIATTREDEEPHSTEIIPPTTEVEAEEAFHEKVEHKLNIEVVPMQSGCEATKTLVENKDIDIAAPENLDTPIKDEKHKHICPELASDRVISTEGLEPENQVTGSISGNASLPETSQKETTEKIGNPVASEDEKQVDLVSNRQAVENSTPVESPLESENNNRIPPRLAQTEIDDIIPIEVGKQREEASDLKLDNTVKCTNHVAEDPEGPSMLRDTNMKIKEVPLQKTLPNLQAVENESDETVAANEIINRIVSKEKIEETQVVELSPSLGKDPSEERVKENEQTAEENAGKRTSEIFLNVKNGISIEEIKEKETNVKDPYTVIAGNETVKERLPEKANGMNVELAAVTMDFEDQEDVCEDATPIQKVEHGIHRCTGDTKGKETVMTKDEKEPHCTHDIPLTMEVAAEEAKIHKLETEVVPTMSGSEPMRTPLENNGIDIAATENLDTAIEDEKLKHASPKSASGRFSGTAGLEPENQVTCSVPDNSTLTETSEQEPTENICNLTASEDEKHDQVSDNKAVENSTAGELMGTNDKNREAEKHSTEDHHGSPDEAKNQSPISTTTREEIQDASEKFNILSEKQESGTVAVLESSEDKQLEETTPKTSEQNIPSDTNESKETTSALGNADASQVEPDQEKDKKAPAHLGTKAMPRNEEVKTENVEAVQFEEAKPDKQEEKKEEEVKHEDNNSGSKALVKLEASRGKDVKVPHKKTILSGVGSKVKHSIAKVKKAITGKSKHKS